MLNHTLHKGMDEHTMYGYELTMISSKESGRMRSGPSLAFGSSPENPGREAVKKGGGREEVGGEGPLPDNPYPHGAKGGCVCEVVQGRWCLRGKCDGRL